MINDWVYIEPDHATAARLMIAVEVLASGKGSIQERLRVASIIISEFRETDFPEELQNSFQKLRLPWSLAQKMSGLQKSL